MKPASRKPAPGHHRCFYRSAAGRQCRSWVIDQRGMFCPRHYDAQPNGPDDYAFHLLQRSCNFKNAEGIRDSLSRLYSLLAADAISPRRAAVLGYLTSLLLRTLPAMYNDPCPQAGTPMSAAQLAERDKPKSLAPPTPQLTATTPPPSQHIQTQPSAPPLAQKPVLASPAVQTNANTSIADDLDHLPKGTRPLPPTGAEFAAQVLKSLTATPPTSTPQQPQTPSTPAAVAATKPNPTALAPTSTTPTNQQSKSPTEPTPNQPPTKSPTESPTKNPSEPADPPQPKKATR